MVGYVTTEASQLLKEGTFVLTIYTHKQALINELHT